MSDTQDPTAPQPDGTPATGGQTAAPPAPAPPAAPPPPAVEPPGTTGEPDWEKKFKGLQAVHQNLTHKHQGLVLEKDTLTTQMTELQGTLESERGEAGSLKTQHEESVAALAETEGQLANLRLWERKLARLQQNAPHLTQFEKFIVPKLPDVLQVDPASLSEEQQTQLDTVIDTAIADFNNVMGAYVEGVTKAEHGGVVPPSSPPKGSGEPTLDTLFQLAIDKAGTPEYPELMEVYQKAAAKESGEVDGEGFWRPHRTQMPMP